MAFIELEELNRAEEIQLAVKQSKDQTRPAVDVWHVLVDGQLYIRSYRGQDSAWFRAARQTHQARIGVHNLDQSVRLDLVSGDALLDRIDEAYRQKYARYSQSYLKSMLNSGARSATLQVTPESD